jgi:hypothetical protein
MGDRDGFVNLCFDNSILTWGSPDNRFVWNALAAGPGGNNTFVVDQSFGGVPAQLALALDLDGNGLLTMLVCAKVPASPTMAVEYNQIVANTASTVTVLNNWVSNPQAGDLLVVGPLAFLVHFSELQSIRPVVPRALRASFAQGAIATPAGWTRRLPPRLLLEQFAASAIATQVTSLVSVNSKAFDATQFQWGTGAIYFAGWSAKAQSMRLTVLQGDDAPAILANLAIEERGA